MDSFSANLQCGRGLARCRRALRQPFASFRSMNHSELGNTDLRVSALGMGCAKLGAVWQGRSLREGVEALHTAYDRGITLFDTADCYARGLSERLVGRAFRRGAPDVVISTK